MFKMKKEPAYLILPALCVRLKSSVYEYHSREPAAAFYNVDETNLQASVYHGDIVYETELQAFKVLALVIKTEL